MRTRTSLENARKGNWEQVVRDEQQRRHIITDLFSSPLDAEEAERYRHTIEEVTRLNSELEQLTADARNRILSEAGSVGKGRRALNKYAENAR
jgi:hypothetical protein